MSEHEAQEQTLIDSGLPYTIFRAAGLVDKKANGDYQIVKAGKMSPSTIERSALAACMLKGLSDDSGRNKALTVTGQN